MSTVNVAEVLSKVEELGPAASRETLALLTFLASIEPFTYSQAVRTAALRPSTRMLGLSLGDRACLSLAIERGAEVYTADRQWSTLTLPCSIHLIR